MSIRRASKPRSRRRLQGCEGKAGSGSAAPRPALAVLQPRRVLAYDRLQHTPAWPRHADATPAPRPRSKRGSMGPLSPRGERFHRLIQLTVFTPLLGDERADSPECRCGAHNRATDVDTARIKITTRMRAGADRGADSGLVATQRRRCPSARGAVGSAKPEPRRLLTSCSTVRGREGQRMPIPGAGLALARHRQAPRMLGSASMCLRR